MARIPAKLGLRRMQVADGRTTEPLLVSGLANHRHAAGGVALVMAVTAPLYHALV
jgi:hypothetical protein